MKLVNDLIELRLLPEFGARITNLIDRRSGRDWIIQGETLSSGAEMGSVGLRSALHGLAIDCRRPGAAACCHAC